MNLQDTTTEIASKIAVSILKDAFKAAANGIKALDKWVGDQAEKRDILGLAARQYAKRMEERYNAMRVLGMTKPVPLRNIYVSVHLLATIRERLHRSIEELEEQFERDKRGYGLVIESKDGIAMVRREQYLIVLGSTRCGKNHIFKESYF